MDYKIIEQPGTSFGRPAYNIINNGGIVQAVFYGERLKGTAERVCGEMNGVKVVTVEPGDCAPPVQVVEQMTPEDAACPILANAPAEYSYWEKRVWRRGVQDAHEQVIQADGSSAREEVKDAVAEALGDAYDCTRSWSAWGVGTMGPDDFELVSEDAERVAEIADAAIAAYLKAVRS